MDVIITRNMTVADDGGSARQFSKSDKPVSVSADVAHRLFRAGAAFKASLREGKVTSDESKGSAGKAKAEKTVDDMTKAELISHAEENEIEVDASANKADILETIKTASA